MKKVVLFITVYLAITITFTVLALRDTNSIKEKLYVLNWDEYIDEALITTFEEIYDCEIVYEVADSNETMYSRVATEYAPYDIIVPSDYMISQMKEEDMLLELDYTKLSNYSKDKFNDKLMSLIDHDVATISNYLVPYFWGSLGIMYNKNVLTEAQIARIQTDGFKVLFDQSFSSAMGMYASSRDSIACALMANGFSVNTKSIDELAIAEASLGQMRYKAWATDDLKVGVASGKYACALVYSGDFFDVLYSALEEEVDINFDIYCPTENNNIFFDAMVIPKTSQNTELAYKFIDFMLVHENSLANASYVGYSPTLKSVYEAMCEDPEMMEVTSNKAYNPGQLNGEIYAYLGKDIYDLYEDIYKRVCGK